MTIKVTFLIQQSTAPSDATRPVHRIGGWSESWYFASNSLQAAITAATSFNPLFGQVGWCNARAGLLGLGAAIVGQRFQVVNPVGPSQSLSQTFPGAAGSEVDYPQGALLCKVPGINALNIRKTILRGLPDPQVFEGEFLPTVAYIQQLNIFFRELGFWQFRGRDLSQPAIRIISISATGIVTTEVAPPFLVGDMVRILKTKLPTGKLVGGRFQVAAVGPGFNQFTLNGWPLGATTIGSARKDLVTFLTVDPNNISVSRVITRRVGRPFAQFRGRRSRSKG